MPTLHLQNWAGKELPLTSERRTLLDVIHGEYLDWMHLCGKRGRCITCRIQIMEGMEHLSPLSPYEERYRRAGALRDDERLTCQTRCLSKDPAARIVGRTPEETQLPHLDYQEA